MKKIGIIGAMDLEVDALKQQMTDVTVTTYASMEFHGGKLGGTDVVVVRCGVGKVNAAICMEILALQFGVTAVINTGIAGSLNAELDIGDILVSRDAVLHDMDVRVFGYALGQVPGMESAALAADEKLAALALETCREVNPEIRCRLGRVLTGDQFISDAAVKERLIGELHGDCAEMEGGAIAQAAVLNKIPFVIIRAISDKADHSAEMDYPTFEKAAARHSAKLVAAMMEKI